MSHQQQVNYLIKNILVSYCCCKNMQQIINDLNKKLLSEISGKNNETCSNCGIKNICLVEENCFASNVVYEAKSEVITKDGKLEEKFYVGAKENEW